MKLTFRTVLLGVIVVGFGLFIANLLREQPVPVDLAEVRQSDIALTVSDDGQTRVREVYVVSSPMNARVLRIEPDVGDEVIAGQTVLVRLLPSTSSLLDKRTRQEALAAVEAAEAAVKLSESEVQRAIAEEDYAVSELRRAQDLVAHNVTSKARFEQAELALKTARAARKSAEAAVLVRKADLATAKAMLVDPLDPNGGDSQIIELTSPVSGRVLSVPDSSEKTVVTGSPLIEVGDPGDLEVVVDLLSTEAVKVKPGDPATLSGWGGLPLSAQVERVEPVGFTKFSALGVEEQRVNIILVPAGEKTQWSRLGHGFRVEAEIEVDRFPDATSVPVSALFRHGEGWAVYRVEEGRAVLRTVELGARSGERVVIDAGLEPGDRVVIFPSANLSDGSLIIERKEMT